MTTSGRLDTKCSLDYQGNLAGVKTLGNVASLARGSAVVICITTSRELIFQLATCLSPDIDIYSLIFFGTGRASKQTVSRILGASWHEPNYLSGRSSINLCQQGQ